MSKIGGQTVSKWRFDLIKDEAPTINLMGTPTTTPRGAFAWYSAPTTIMAWRAPRPALRWAKARSAISRRCRRKPAPSDADPLLEPPVDAAAIAASQREAGRRPATQDLTAHPWAGLKVRMTLVARDQAGQTGESLPYEFMLPERTFTKPLAKAVVEQRKKLVRDADSAEASPSARCARPSATRRRSRTAPSISACAIAHWRLRQRHRRAEAMASVVDQLWDVALRIEEGDLPEAERDVKQAQDKLSQALKEKASPEEIKRLVDELREALSHYLQALASQQQDKGNCRRKASRTAISSCRSRISTRC